jgi:hypothetical protein
VSPVSCCCCPGVDHYRKKTQEYKGAGCYCTALLDRRLFFFFCLVLWFHLCWLGVRVCCAVLRSSWFYLLSWPLLIVAGQERKELLCSGLFFLLLVIYLSTRSTCSSSRSEQTLDFKVTLRGDIYVYLDDAGHIGRPILSLSLRLFEPLTAPVLLYCSASSFFSLYSGRLMIAELCRSSTKRQNLHIVNCDLITNKHKTQKRKEIKKQKAITARGSFNQHVII